MLQHHTSTALVIVVLLLTVSAACGPQAPASVRPSEPGATNAPSAPPSPADDAKSSEPDASEADAREPVPATGSLVEGQRNPTVASKHMLRMIAAGTWPIARFIDPSRGVLIVEYHDRSQGTVDSPEADAAKAQSMCGSELTRELSEYLELVQMLIADEEDEEIEIACRDSADDHSCTVESAGEFGNTYDLYFRLDPNRGLILEYISSVETAMPEGFYKRAAEFLAKSRDRHRTHRCPQ